MTVIDIIAARQIDEAVHFTSSHGCLGTIYTKQLQSRQRLEGDPMVEYLFKPNARLRKDPEYLDYVSLSISHINTQFYSISSSSWHRGEPIFWCILSFDPIVLSHTGVWFATTNNIYSSVKRGVGATGLKALYADQVVLWRDSIVRRFAGLSACHPTCPQAEALYPSAISTDHLRRIYVTTHTDQSEVIGFLKATFHRDVEVLVAPGNLEIESHDLEPPDSNPLVRAMGRVWRCARLYHRTSR
jgi:hypothetical protein